MTAPILSVLDICKSYGDVRVLRDVSLDVQAGDLVCVIGPSGCGKSTLLRCLDFLEHLDSGRITVAGSTVTRATTDTPWTRELSDAAFTLRGHVGMVFQSLNLFPDRTVLQNVMLAPMLVKKLPRAEARAQALALLEKVGLTPFLDRFPAALSGGQQQRAAIARALAMKPKVMFYDEPTSALDPTLVDEVEKVMRGLDQEGMTQIVVTHEMRFARDMSDYIAFMQDGVIVEIAPPEAIFTAPKDPRTASFLKRFR